MLNAQRATHTPTPKRFYGTLRLRTFRRLRSGGQESALQNITRNISNRTPSPLSRRRALNRAAEWSARSGAGEPPGHTHRRFCRDGSPNVFERPGQNVLWSPSALRHNATHTKRNNATLTQRRDANTLGRTAEGRQLGKRSQTESYPGRSSIFSGCIITVTHGEVTIYQ